MNLKDIKKQDKEFIKNLLLKHYMNKHQNLIQNTLNLEKEINESIHHIKLNDLDYLDIKNEITNILLSQNISKTKHKKIIDILAKKYKSTSFEIEIDGFDVYIYYNLHNNTSYLINYDSINETWYLSLIESDSLNLIKEIYSDEYNNFITFLSNLKSR